MKTTLTNNEIAEALKELMEKYDLFREEWIKSFGSDNGFDEWFTEKVSTL